jgi:carboxyl-terminal processing protease
VNLTVTQKTQTLDKIEGYIETRFFNPSAELPAWKESWPEARGWIQASSRSEDFEERVRQSLTRLRSSHVAFFHGSGQGVPAPYALNATFLKSDDAYPVWVFLDVLEGGVALKAGIETGESLVAINGNRVRPPEMPRFDLGSTNELSIASRAGETRSVPLVLPAPTDKGKPPMAEVRTVHARKLSDRVGCVFHRRIGGPGEQRCGDANARGLDHRAIGAGQPEPLGSSAYQGVHEPHDGPFPAAVRNAFGGIAQAVRLRRDGEPQHLPA